MNDFFSMLIPILVVAMVMASFGEMAISGMWLPAYYRYSIPLFRKEYPLTTMPDLVAKIPELEQKLKRSMWRPAIVFRALDGNDIAFRNSFGSRNAMSGLIRLEPSHGKMRITGHLNWTVFLVPLLFFVIVFNSPMSIVFLIFFLAIIALASGMQRYHYGQIAKVIVETATSTSSVQGVFAEPSTISDLETPFYESKPEQTFEGKSKPIEYHPEYEPYDSTKPKTGLNNTEITLLVVLVALIVIAGVAAFLFLVGG